MDVKETAGFSREEKLVNGILLHLMACNVWFWWGGGAHLHKRTKSTDWGHWKEDGAKGWAAYQVSASFAISLTESIVYCETWKLFFLRTCLVRGIRGDNTWCHQNSWKITRFWKGILRYFSSYLQKIGLLTKSWHFNIIVCAMKAMFWFLLIDKNVFFAHFRFDQNATTCVCFPASEN